MWFVMMKTHHFFKGRQEKILIGQQKNILTNKNVFLFPCKKQKQTCDAFKSKITSLILVTD